MTEKWTRNYAKEITASNCNAITARIEDQKSDHFILKDAIGIESDIFQFFVLCPQVFGSSNTEKT